MLSNQDPVSLAGAIERAAKTGESRGFRFVKNDKWVESFYSFEEIEAHTRKIAGALQDIGLQKGDRCALILPDNAAFVLTFLGALRAGVVPVPIYPPMSSGQLGGYLDNTRHIVARCSARALVTVPVIKGLLGKVQAACPALETVATFGALEESNRAFQPVEIKGDDVAFLQFTSGSTAKPKGVVLTHANLLANIRNIVVEGLRIDPKVDAALGWLPLYHDMGLIGFVLAPVVATIHTTFLTPMTFLFRPASWMQAMSRYRTGMTFGPNFAYALCVKRVRDQDLEGVDLSHLRVAGCGAEPIRAETLEAFADRYAKYGFRKEAFYPAYGLAESTLAVSFANGLPTDRVKASVLWSDGRAEPADGSQGNQARDADDTLRIVSCGKAFEGHEIGVFALDDDAGDRPLADRVVGELRLRGPSVSQGYFEEPELTRRAFAGGWFRTGDLGYKADGETFLCGRSKELLIVHGRNYYPQDIEWEASQIEGVRKGNVVVFGTSGAESQGEGAVLVFETGEADGPKRERIVADVRARVMEFTGFHLDDVVPVASGVLPKTSSGKLQRTKTRDLYERGELSGRASAREADRVGAVKEIASSQLAYLKLAVFGSKKRSG